MSQDPYSKLSSSGLDFVPTIHHDTYPTIDPTKADLTGKTVLITGASKGIGRATAISFAKAGASTIIIGARSSLSDVESDVLSAAKAAGRPQPQVITLELDVSSQSSVEAAAGTVAAKAQHVDVLINNAGFLEPWEKVQDSDPGNWWRTYEINVLGTYLMCRSFLPLVLKSPELRTVLNVVSAGAHRVVPGASAYQSSKLALCRFTEFLVEENRKEGLLAFCAHPGGVDTGLARGMPEFMMSVLGDSAELAGDSFVAWTGGRREWLCGRYVSVNWDLEELEGKREEVVRGDLLKVRMAVGGLG